MNRVERMNEIMKASPDFGKRVGYKMCVVDELHDMKERLEKEATAYALEWGDKTDGTYACCRDGYLAAAEPREKRIEALEKSCDETQELLDKQNKAEAFLKEASE